MARAPVPMCSRGGRTGTVARKRIKTRSWWRSRKFSATRSARQTQTGAQDSHDKDDEFEPALEDRRSAGRSHTPTSAASQHLRAVLRELAAYYNVERLAQPLDVVGRPRDAAEGEGDTAQRLNCFRTSTASFSPSASACLADFFP